MPQAALSRGALSAEILRRWLSVVNIPVIGALAKLSPAFRQGPWLPPLAAVLKRQSRRTPSVLISSAVLDVAAFCRALQSSVRDSP